MKFIIVFVVVNYLAVFAKANLRIVNGTDAEEGEFPYAVSLRQRRGNHICGGTILNCNHILTAAHCVCNNKKGLDASQYSIQYGQLEISPNNVNTIQVKEIYCHKFDPENLIYDAAILELQEEIPKEKCTPVKLSKDFTVTSKKDDLPHGTIIGWGRTSPDSGSISKKLQKIDVDIYDEETCAKKYDNKHHICFGTPFGGACNGDSGTALIVDDEQVGIASFITEKCGITNPEHPNVYAKVSSYYDWIAEVAKL